MRVDYSPAAQEGLSSRKVFRCSLLRRSPPLGQLSAYRLCIRRFDLFKNPERRFGVGKSLLALTWLIQAQAHIPQRVPFGSPVASLSRYHKVLLVILNRFAGLLLL